MWGEDGKYCRAVCASLGFGKGWVRGGWTYEVCGGVGGVWGMGWWGDGAVVVRYWGTVGLLLQGC